MSGKIGTTRSKTSPTKLSLDRLRKHGYTVQVVEHWNQWARRRVDLFGCVDVFAMHASYRRNIGVQATSRQNVSSRIAKIRELAEAAVWLKCGNALEVWGWDNRDGRNRVLRVCLKISDAGTIEEAQRIEE